jgi:hypothetical protein
MWAIAPRDFECIQAVFGRKDINFEVRDSENNGTVLDYTSYTGNEEIISIVQWQKKLRK